MPKLARKELSQLDNDLANFEQWIATLPTQIANVYMNFFLDSFKRRGFIDGSFQKWKPRKRNSGKRRNILVNSGRLRRSLQFRIRGNFIEFYTNVPYAQIHNEGGTIRGSQKVKSHRRTRNGKTHKVKSHKRQVAIKIPKRQFMGKSALANRRIIKNLENQLKKIFG